MNSILADSQRLRLHLLAWLLVGILLGLLVQALLETSLMTSLLFAIPLGIVAAPISLSAGYVCRAIPLARTGAFRLAMTALAAAILTASLWAVIGQFWWEALGRLGFEVPVASQAQLFVLADRARCPGVSGGGYRALRDAGARRVDVRGPARAGGAGRRAGRGAQGPSCAGRSALSLQQPQLRVRADRTGSGQGAADVPAAR